MTTIRLIINGAKARAEVAGTLTSGMVGLPVTIVCDDTWQGLAKNLVCRSRGRYDPPDAGCVRVIANVGTAACVAHEVMEAGKYLYLGVEGYGDDGRLVMPTTWAECGIIAPGAHADAPQSADPTLPVWAQLEADLARLQEEAVTQDGINDRIAAYLKENPVAQDRRFDAGVWGLPVLALTGDTAGMTKDNAVSLRYAYGERSGSCTVKWQGSSSLAYPKKNYTIIFDRAFEAGTGWGEQKKYCLKANYIDHSHARNVVSAKLWGRIVKSRTSIVPVNTNVFDLNAITSFQNALGTVQNQFVSIADGVVTSLASIGQTGYLYWVGQTYVTGTYIVSFDVKQNTDFRNPISLGFGTGWNVVETLTSAVGTEWTHFDIAVTNTVPDAYLFIQSYDGDSLTQSVDIKNIQVIKQGASGVGDLVNGGAIDGFPVIITLNGAFHGLYTFNIPKDGWMLGMGSGEREAILCADYSDACWFRGEATLDGDFDLEYVSDENDTAWVRSSVNRLISAVMDSDGTNLDGTIAQYLDWESAIDYLIFKNLLNGIDMDGKNYILATLDGTKWFFSAYDMDCVYGLDWDGKSFYGAVQGVTFTGGTNVDKLILTCKKEELKARYAQLRSDIMSDDAVAQIFTNFMGQIPTPVYLEDARAWPGIPSTASNNLAQIVTYYRMHAAALDQAVAAL